MRGAVGHFGGERNFSEISVTQELGFFSTQGENLVNQGPVIPCCFAEFRGAGSRGAIHARTQIAVVGVLQNRHVGGRMQGEFPAGLAVFFSRSTRGSDGVFWQAGKIRRIAYPFSMGVGGVQHVFRKLGSQGGERFLNFLKARFFIFGELCARQAKVAQLVVDNGLPCGGEFIKCCAFCQGFVFGKQGQILPQIGIKAGNFRQ